MSENGSDLCRLRAPETGAVIQQGKAIAQQTAQRTNGKDDAHILVMQALKFLDFILAVVQAELPENAVAKIAGKAQFGIIEVGGGKHIALGINGIQARLWDEAAIGLKLTC